MAPLRASCHGKPRAGCRSLSSFFYYNPSVYPLRGRHILAKLLVRRNLFKGIPLKAAAYWYSVFKFPTFRRKAQALKPVISIKDYVKFFYSQKWVFCPILTHLCGYPAIHPHIPQFSDKNVQNKRRPKISHFSGRLTLTLINHYHPLIKAVYIFFPG